jgi:hypothetical protein
MLLAQSDNSAAVMTMTPMLGDQMVSQKRMRVIGGLHVA